MCESLNGYPWPGNEKGIEERKEGSVRESQHGELRSGLWPPCWPHTSTQKRRREKKENSFLFFSFTFLCESAKCRSWPIISFCFFTLSSVGQDTHCGLADSPLRVNADRHHSLSLPDHNKFLHDGGLRRLPRASHFSFFFYNSLGQPTKTHTLARELTKRKRKGDHQPGRHLLFHCSCLLAGHKVDGPTH